VIEEIIVRVAWASVEANERCDIGFKVTEYTVVCLKRFGNCGVGKWSKAIV